MGRKPTTQADDGLIPAEEPPNKPGRVPPEDALGNPIPPETPKHGPNVRIIDSASNNVLFQSRYVPLPKDASQPITVDMMVDGTRLFDAYKIDAIDEKSNRVLVTRVQHLVDDVPIDEE